VVAGKGPPRPDRTVLHVSVRGFVCAVHGPGRQGAPTVSTRRHTHVSGVSGYGKLNTAGNYVRSCLLPPKNIKIFKIFRHIESL